MDSGLLSHSWLLIRECNDNKKALPIKAGGIQRSTENPSGEHCAIENRFGGGGVDTTFPIPSTRVPLQPCANQRRAFRPAGAPTPRWRGYPVALPSCSSPSTENPLSCASDNLKTIVLGHWLLRRPAALNFREKVLIPDRSGEEKL
ncbi:hypothetical protein CEXT_735821 [Caerostris extrusa]|uniref:Uncharacterized protein n=1 Tax=Caerostris extrusa TaxID=172846 RepID=A0AAV4NVW1_CAEEX|nr:hypothetical protein CEXT_735821 [Caerostris extrusa]